MTVDREGTTICLATCSIAAAMCRDDQLCVDLDGGDNGACFAPQ